MASNGNYPNASATDYKQWWSYNKSRTDLENDLANEVKYSSDDIAKLRHIKAAVYRG